MKRKGLSAVTIGLGIYIVLSASFMLQVRSWLLRVFTEPLVVNSFRVFFIIIFISVLFYALRLRLGLFRICAASFIFMVGFFFIMWQPYFSEKTHVLTYGLLGYLAARDLIHQREGLSLKGISLALTFAVLISALDEIFQKMLPYRVGEIRDFITNIISALLGLSLYLILKGRFLIDGGH